MLKQRLALGLFLIVITSMGLYAVNTEKKENTTINYTISENNEPLKANVITEESNTSTQLEVIEQPIIPKFPQYDVPMPLEWQDWLYNQCQVYGVQYELALAMIQKESNFDANSIHKNSNGTLDYGLFQINCINLKWLAEELNISNFLDPYQNIKAGTYMIKKSMENSDNDHIALMKFNMGADYTKRLNNRGVFSSQYSRDIIQERDKLLNNN